MTVSHVLIIFNPTSGSSSVEKVEAVKSALVSQGCAVDVYATQAAGDATEYLSNYTGALDVVAVAGGDGTVNEVVNGLTARHDGYRLALIPTGTTNVLAMELGVPRSIKGIVKTILGEHERAVYLGKINQRRFVLMVGVGFDAWVVDRVDLKLKKKIGKLAYVLSMLKQIPQFGRKHYTLLIDGVEHRANSVVITNGRFYGGAFILSRKASLSAATTQVLMIKGRSPWAFAGILLGLPLGIMETMPGVTSVAATEVSISEIDVHGEMDGEIDKEVSGNMKGTHEREPVQADGDSLTELPLTLQMEDTPIRILAPVLKS